MMPPALTVVLKDTGLSSSYNLDHTRLFWADCAWHLHGQLRRERFAGQRTLTARMLLSKHPRTTKTLRILIANR